MAIFHRKFHWPYKTGSTVLKNTEEITLSQIAEDVNAIQSPITYSSCMIEIPQFQEMLNCTSYNLCYI